VTVTRAADIATAPIGSWCAASSAVTLCFEGIIPWSGAAGIWALWQLDDGSSNNRLGAWLQPGNTAVTMYDAYGSGISDTGIARGAVTPLVPFKMAAAFTARNAAMVLNGGTAGAAVPLHWPGLLFTRMLIGSYVSPGTNMLDGFIARIRGWAAYLATADLQMMTLPIPVAQTGARGAADGSGLALPLGVASVFGRGAGVARGQSAPPSVLTLLAAQGFGASAMRGDITVPGTALSALGQARGRGQAAASLTTRNGPQISVIV
jgi:hypothetical protein